MDILGRIEKDSELTLLAKQLAFGSVLGVAFLAVVYIGGLLAHLISGC